MPVPDTSLADIAGKAGVSPEIISAMVVFVAPLLVSPLAAVWKRWRGTTGPDTRAVIKVLTALIVGVGGFALGLYGYDLRGIVNAIGAAVLAYLKTTGDYERDVNVQAKADRVSAARQASATPAPGGDLEPATLADVEAELMRQTGEWPGIPGIDYER